MPTAVNAHEFGASIYATPDGRHAVSSARDGFRIWDVAKREIIRGRAQDDAFRMAALSAGGGQLIFFDASVEQPREPSRPRDIGMMGLCDLPSGEIEWEFPAYIHTVQAIIDPALTMGSKGEYDGLISWDDSEEILRRDLAYSRLNEEFEPYQN